MKDQQRAFGEPVFRTTLDVTLTDDMEDAARRHRWAKDSAAAAVKDAQGASLGTDDRVCGLRLVLLFHRKHLTHGLIAHEVAHAGDEMCAAVGVPISLEANEVRAYYIEWATDRIYRWLGSLRVRVGA